MLVYDITDRDTFNNIDSWLAELGTYAEDNIVKLLIGNKKDLQQIRAVSTDEALEYAKRNNMAFFEASALEGTNVHKAFDQIMHEVFRLAQSQPDKGRKTKSDNDRIKLVPKKPNKAKKCC